MPEIVIVGRPNVGKSTLFNRLIGKRRAITDPTPGVTRDPIYERYLLGNHPVILVDSGGIKGDRDEMDELVSKKSLDLFPAADAIVFMMDCTEVTAEDEWLAEQLQPYKDKTVVAVNKVDDVTRESLVWNFFAFGFQRVLGISSAQGNGIGELEDALMGLLDIEESYEAPEEEVGIKLSVMGKPNTGKSTLTNLLTESDLSIVSPIPGTTRDVVKGSFSYKGENFTILDTAGIRRKGKVEEDVEYYSVNRAIKSIDEADTVLLMVDCMEGLSEQDKKIAQLVVRRGCGVIIVLNKTDLLTVPNQFNAIEDRVRFLFPVLSFAPLVGISAAEGKGVEELLDTVLKVYRQLNRRIDTSTLNEALRSWGEAYQPPRGKEGHYKVLYGTQVGTNPVRFLLFVNRIKGFPDVYLNYLKNCIRKDLGFSSVPVEINLRERARNESKPGDRSKSLMAGTADVPPAKAGMPSKEAAGKKLPRDIRNRKPVFRQTGGKAKAKPERKKPGGLSYKTRKAERNKK